MAQVQERRPASNWAPGSAPPPPEPPSFAARLVVGIQRHRKALRRLGLAASLLIIAISLTIFARTLMRIDPAKFRAAFAATGGDQILMAFGFTALSYLALTGYDGLALRHLRVKVPYRLTALASFASYAVSFTLGFPAGDRRGGPLLALFAGRAHGREHRQPDDRRRHNLLARHGAHRRRRLHVQLRRGRRDRPLPPAREPADRALGDRPARSLPRLGRRPAAGAARRSSAISSCRGRC